MRYDAMPEISASADSHSKFAIRLFFVRRTNHKQGCLHNHQSAAHNLRKQLLDSDETTNRCRFEQRTY